MATEAARAMDAERAAIDPIYAALYVGESSAADTLLYQALDRVLPTPQHNARLVPPVREWLQAFRRRPHTLSRTQKVALLMTTAALYVPVRELLVQSVRDPLRRRYFENYLDRVVLAAFDRLITGQAAFDLLPSGTAAAAAAAAATSAPKRPRIMSAIDARVAEMNGYTQRTGGVVGTSGADNTAFYVHAREHAGEYHIDVMTMDTYVAILVDEYTVTCGPPLPPASCGADAIDNAMPEQYTRAAEANVVAGFQ